MPQNCGKRINQKIQQDDLDLMLKHYQYMYLGIKAEDIMKFNLPNSKEELLNRMRKEFKLKDDFRKLRWVYRDLMIQYCKNEAKRIQISNLYYLYRCQQFNNDAQINVLMVINNDYKRLDQMLKENSMQKARQIANMKYHGFAIIYYSARTGLRKPMRVLIKHGSVFNLGGDKSSPIHAASFFGQIDILKLLIDLGAPIDIKNQFDNLPFDQTSSEQIKNLLKNAYTNEIDKLNYRLSRQGKSNGIFRIFYNGELVGRKIILNNYEFKSHNRIKTFHGTRFQVIESIVKNGMKMAGDDIGGGRKLEVCPGHFQQQQKFFGIKNFAQGIFSSQSIIYAGCPVYAKTTKFQIDGKIESLDTILQLRVKKQFYDQFVSTVNSKYAAMGQPQKLQVRIGFDQRKKFYDDVIKGIIKTLSKEPAEVQAIIFVKTGFLMKNLKKQGITEEMNKLFLESEEQKYFLLRKQ